MEYLFQRWRGKPILLSKHAAQNVLDLNVPLAKVFQVLEEGVENTKKREGGVFEFVKGFKNEVLKVVVGDAGDNWRVITIVKFRR